MDDTGKWAKSRVTIKPLSLICISSSSFAAN